MIHPLTGQHEATAFKPTPAASAWPCPELVADPHGLTGPRDVAAVDEWIHPHDEDGRGPEVKSPWRPCPP